MAGHVEKEMVVFSFIAHDPKMQSLGNSLQDVTGVGMSPPHHHLHHQKKGRSVHWLESAEEQSCLIDIWFAVLPSKVSYS